MLPRNKVKRINYSQLTNLTTVPAKSDSTGGNKPELNNKRKKTLLNELMHIQQLHTYTCTLSLYREAESEREGFWSEEKGTESNPCR